MVSKGKSWTGALDLRCSKECLNNFLGPCIQVIIWIARFFLQILGPATYAVLEKRIDLCVMLPSFVAVLFAELGVHEVANACLPEELCGVLALTLSSIQLQCIREGTEIVMLTWRADTGEI